MPRSSRHTSIVMPTGFLPMGTRKARLLALLFFVLSGVGWSGGFEAKIFSVSNAEAAGTPQWRVLENAPIAGTHRHEDIFFFDADTGWIVNGPGQVWKTTDAGSSWNLVHEFSGFFARSVGFVTAQHGWCGNLDTSLGPLLAETFDGGSTWQEVTGIPEPLPTGICGISIVSEDVVFAVGRIYEPSRMLRTTDAGSTWENIDLNPWLDRAVDIHFTDAMNGFVVGGVGPGLSFSQARVIQTTDGGATWTIRHTTDLPSSRWCWKISFPSPLVGYASIESSAPSSDDSYILKTIDGGLTWDEVLVVNGYHQQGLGFVDELNGWVGGELTGSWATTDGGTTWQEDAFDQNLNRVRFLSADLGYAVGKRAYKYSVDPVSSVEQGPQPSISRMGMNFPNPFRDRTTIRYRVPERAPVRIVIRSVQGREIAVLVDQKHDPGSYTIDFVPEDDLPAGFYFFRFESGDYDEAGEMIYFK